MTDRKVIGTLFALKDSDGDYIRRDFVIDEFDREIVFMSGETAAFETRSDALFVADLIDKEDYEKPEVVKLDVLEAKETKNG